MTGDHVGFSIQSPQGTVRLMASGPENAEFIFVELGDLPPRGDMPRDRPRFAIKLVQAAAIGYPESSRSVFAHKVYSVPSDACGVRRIMGVTSGLPRGGIQLVKSSGCCQPQDSGGVFRDSL